MDLAGVEAELAHDGLEEGGLAAAGRAWKEGKRILSNVVWRSIAFLVAHVMLPVTQVYTNTVLHIGIESEDRSTI